MQFASTQHALASRQRHVLGTRMQQHFSVPGTKSHPCGSCSWPADVKMAFDRDGFFSVASKPFPFTPYRHRACRIPAHVNINFVKYGFFMLPLRHRPPSTPYRHRACRIPADVNISFVRYGFFSFCLYGIARQVDDPRLINRKLKCIKRKTGSGQFCPGRLYQCISSTCNKIQIIVR